MSYTNERLGQSVATGGRHLVKITQGLLVWLVLVEPKWISSYVPVRPPGGGTVFLMTLKGMSFYKGAVNGT